MQDFLTFITQLLSAVSSFLMTEPIVWFVGVFLFGAVVAVFHKLISFK